MKKNRILPIIAAVMIISVTPFTTCAQTSDTKSTAKAPAIKRLYFDHRGRVDTVYGDTLVINDRTYKVLSTVTLLAKDQTPLAGLSKLKEGDFIGFSVDDKRRINAIYLLSPPKKQKNKQ